MQLEVAPISGNIGAPGDVTWEVATAVCGVLDALVFLASVLHRRNVGTARGTAWEVSTAVLGVPNTLVQTEGASVPGNVGAASDVA